MSDAQGGSGNGQNAQPMFQIADPVGTFSDWQAPLYSSMHQLSTHSGNDDSGARRWTFASIQNRRMSAAIRWLETLALEMRGKIWRREARSEPSMTRN